jgi:hypothetical protein
MSRFPSVARWLLAAGLLTAGLSAPVALAGPKPPQQQAPIHRGAELVATQDVDIHNARISKGSHVRVVDVAFANGKPSTVSLELKDGHVLKLVPYERVAKSFRAVKG